MARRNYGHDTERGLVIPPSEIAQAKSAQAARDVMVSRRSSIAMMITTFVMLTVAPLGLAVNLIVAMVLNLPPRVDPDIAVSQLEMWSGVLPFPVPAWTGLLCVASVALLLAINWSPSRHLLHPSPKFFLWMHPLFVFIVAGLTGSASITCAVFYQPLDGSFSWWWATALAAWIVAIIALVHGVPWKFLRQTKARSRKRKSRG